MNRLDNFWRRLSLANGSGVSLALDRRHPYGDDLLMLRSILIKATIDNGEYVDVYWLCNLAEHYGDVIDIIPNFEITSYMMMVHNMLKAELGLPFNYDNPEFDRLFKAFVGMAVLSHGVNLLRKKGWKRFAV